MTEHARLSASSAHRWMHCAGAPRMEAGLPDVDTEYSIEGTAAHSLAARMLLDVPNALESTAPMPVRRKDGETVYVPVTNEMRDALSLYVSVVRDALRDAGDGARLYVERKVSLAQLEPPEPMFGTADAVIVGPGPGKIEGIFFSGIVHVIDLKYGTGVVVEVRDNPQLMEYALAAKLSLDTADLAGLSPLFRTTIVQPRAPHTEGPVRSHEYTFRQLREFGHVLVAAAKATQAPDAALTPGRWCRWCKAAAFCPALMRASQEAAQNDFGDGPQGARPAASENQDRPVTAVVRYGETVPAAVIDAEYEIAPVTPPDPDRLTIAQAAAVLDKSEMVLGFLAAVKERVRAELELGNDVPGWKLVRGRASREWAAEDTELEQIFGTELYDRVRRSVAQVEKIVGRKNLPEDLVRKVHNTVQVARADDPRPAIASGPQQEFAALPPAPSSTSTQHGAEPEIPIEQ